MNTVIKLQVSDKLNDYQLLSMLLVTKYKSRLLSVFLSAWQLRLYVNSRLNDFSLHTDETLARWTTVSQSVSEHYTLLHIRTAKRVTLESGRNTIPAPGDQHKGSEPSF